MLKEFLQGQDIKILKEFLDDIHAHDLADMFLELTQEEKDKVYQLLSSEKLAELVSYLEVEEAAEVLSDFDVEKQVELVEMMEPDDAADIILELDEDEQEELLENLDEDSEIKELIVDYPVSYAKDSITKTVQAIRNYGIYEMPVLNEKNELLGMITLDDALDIYQEEAQEDYERLSALPDTEEHKNAFLTALHRLPWLLSLLIISFPIALVTRQFEHVLATVAILVVFQPLILDSAGNVATQTLAVTLRMLSSEEKGMGVNAWREILTGVINGLVIGAIAFIMTFIFAKVNPSLTTDPILISFVVGLSLWLTVIMAPVVALLIPVTLNLLKIDPAVASGPFITTLIDVAALFIYFGLATFMLGGI